MVRKIDIIVPTWNNPEFLNPCVHSIARTGVLNDLANLIIVNNGKQDMAEFKSHPAIVVLEPGKNLGWEGGLAHALEVSDACFKTTTHFCRACRRAFINGCFQISSTTVLQPSGRRRRLRRGGIRFSIQRFR